MNSDIQTLAEAFHEVAATMKAVHKVFIRLAIWIPAILCLFMLILTIVIVKMGLNSEERMAKRLEAVPADIAKMLHIEQNQSLNVGGDPVKEMAKEILKKEGSL